MTAQMQLPDELLAKFRPIDISGDGRIDPQELQAFIATVFPSIGEDDAQALQAMTMENHDINRDGYIDAREFIAAVQQLISAVAQHAVITENLSSDEIDMLRDAFIRMDGDGDGLVSEGEMLAVVRHILGEQRFPTMAQYLRPIFAVADKDRDDKLSLTEFLTSFAEGPGAVPMEVINACIAAIRVRLTDAEIATLQDSFRRIDINQDGFIDRHELMVAMKDVLLSKFPTLTDKTFEDIVAVVMASADTDGDGKLSMSEFIRSFQEDQGVLPSAFCDVRSQQIARQLTAPEIDLLKEVFHALEHHNGFADFSEMYETIFDALSGSLSNKAQVQELCDLIMAAVDHNKDGRLSLTDFIRNFSQNLDMLRIPVAATRDRCRRAAEQLQTLIARREMASFVFLLDRVAKQCQGSWDGVILSKFLTDELRLSFAEWEDETVAAVVEAILGTGDVDAQGRLNVHEFLRAFVASQPEAEGLTQADRAVISRVLESMSTAGETVVPSGTVRQALTDAFGASTGSAHDATQKMATAMEYAQPLSGNAVDLKQLAQSFTPPVAPSETSMLYASAMEALQDPRRRSDIPPRPRSPVARQLSRSVALMTPPQRDFEDVKSPIVNDVSGVCVSEAQLRRAFRRYDADHSGTIDRNEFKQAYMAMEFYGLLPSKQEVERMFCRYGTGDRITFEEFSILMLHRSRM